MPQLCKESYCPVSRVLQGGWLLLLLITNIAKFNIILCKKTGFIFPYPSLKLLSASCRLWEGKLLFHPASPWLHKHQLSYPCLHHIRQVSCHHVNMGPILLRNNSSWYNWKWNAAFMLCAKEDDEDLIKDGSTSASLDFGDFFCPLLFISSHPMNLVSVLLHQGIYQDCSYISCCWYLT